MAFVCQLWFPDTPPDSSSDACEREAFAAAGGGPRLRGRPEADPEGMAACGQSLEGFAQMQCCLLLEERDYVFTRHLGNYSEFPRYGKNFAEVLQVLGTIAVKVTLKPTMFERVIWLPIGARIQDLTLTYLCVINRELISTEFIDNSPLVFDFYFNFIRRDHIQRLGLDEQFRT